MSCYEELIGRYVKVRLQGDDHIYGTLEAEDLHTIFLRFKNGDLIPIGKPAVIRCMPWTDRRGG